MYTFFGTKMTNSHFLLWIWYNGCSFLIKQAVSEFWQVVRKKNTIIRYYRKGKILASHIVNSLVLEAFRRGIITLCAACTLESIGTLANTVKCWFFSVLWNFNCNFMYSKQACYPLSSTISTLIQCLFWVVPEELS